MLCADMVDTCWKDQGGHKQRVTALLEDICSSGACLQFEIPVPLGTEIRWQSPKQEFKGRVRYCIYREIGYFVGVEFTGPMRWSQNTYKPQHLLDLGTLLKRAGK
jgi:hypothetical protein